MNAKIFFFNDGQSKKKFTIIYSHVTILWTFTCIKGLYASILSTSNHFWRSCSRKELHRLRSKYLRMTTCVMTILPSRWYGWFEKWKSSYRYLLSPIPVSIPFLPNSLVFDWCIFRETSREISYINLMFSWRSIQINNICKKKKKCNKWLFLKLNVCIQNDDCTTCNSLPVLM